MTLTVDPEWEIHPAEVKQALDAGETLLLLDVRLPGEWETAHLAGARLVPLDQLERHLPALQEWQDRLVVVHCHHGVRSLKAAHLLRAQGFGHVRSMAGGIDAWSLLVDAAVKRY